MNTPVVALDWLDDMSVPSNLPCRKRFLSTCVEEEVEERPALDSIFAHFEAASSDEIEKDSGTVKRKAPLPERSGARSPIRFDGGKDLFSPGPEMSCLGRRRSEVLTGSPTHFDAALEPIRRKSFLRPRIATETFKDPSKSSMPRRSAPAAPTNPATAAIKEALRKTDSRQVYDVFFSDAMRVSPSRSPSPSSSVYSQSTGSETLITPPTTQKPAGRSKPISYRYTSSKSQVQPSRSCIKTQTSPTASPNFSRPLSAAAAQDYSLPPSRKVSFADRSFLWEKKDAERKIDRRKSSLAERSPFPAPPGQHEKRDFSFELGLHAQEKKCEEEFEEKQSSRGQNEPGRLASRKRESGQWAGRRSRASTTSELELRQEHQRLRREMALLREEFRALRQTLVEWRR